MIFAILIPVILFCLVIGIVSILFYLVYADGIRNRASDRELFTGRVEHLEGINKVEREGFAARTQDLKDTFQNQREDYLIRIEKLETERDEWRDKAMIRSNYTPIQQPENRIQKVPTESYMPNRAAQQAAVERFNNHQFPEVEELPIEA